MNPPTSPFDKIHSITTLARVKHLDSRFSNAPSRFDQGAFTDALARILEQLDARTDPLQFSDDETSSLVKIREHLERARYLFIDRSNDPKITNHARGWSFRHVYWLLECKILTLLDTRSSRPAEHSMMTIWTRVADNLLPWLRERALLCDECDFLTLAQHGRRLRAQILHLSEEWRRFSDIEHELPRLQAFATALQCCAATLICSDNPESGDTNAVVSNAGAETDDVDEAEPLADGSFLVFTETTFRFMHMSALRALVIPRKGPSRRHAGDPVLYAARVDHFAQWLHRKVASFDDESFFKEYAKRKKERLLALGAREYVDGGMLRDTTRLMYATQGQARDMAITKMYAAHALHDRDPFLYMFCFSQVMLTFRIAFDKSFVFYEHAGSEREILREDTQFELATNKYPVIVENFHNFDVYYRKRYHTTRTVANALFAWLEIVRNEFDALIASVDLNPLYKEWM